MIWQKDKETIKNMKWIWKAISKNEKYNINIWNVMDELNNLFDTAEKKVNELEDKDCRMLTERDGKTRDLRG